MQNLRTDDIDHSKFLGRDASNAMESEFRQFERRIDIVQRYVENLVTGAFLRVKNDVDLSQTREVMDKQVSNSMV